MRNPILDYDGVDLFIHKTAALKMLKHCSDFSHLKLEVMGFMVGHKYEWEGEEYTVVEDVVTSDLDTSNVSVKFSSFEPLFKELNRFEREGRDFLLVGWYHSHPGHTSFMSPTDQDTQKRMFKKDYQSAIVIDPIRIEMKAFTLREDEVFEKPYAIIVEEGEDKEEDDEKAAREEKEVEDEHFVFDVDEDMVEGEMHEEDMVETWEDSYGVEEEELVHGVEEYGEPEYAEEGAVRENTFFGEDYGEAHMAEGDGADTLYDHSYETPSDASYPGSKDGDYDPNKTSVVQRSDPGIEKTGAGSGANELDAFDYAWFAAPVLMGLLGGIFGMMAIGKRKKGTGKWMIILGFIFTLIWFSGSYLLQS